MSDRNKIITLVSLCTILVIAFIGTNLTWDNYQYFLSLRIPKILALTLAATAIAQSSLVFQTMTHNRILTPNIMGFDSLYLLIQVMILITLGQFSLFFINPYINFGFSVLIMIGFSCLLFWLFFQKQTKSLSSQHTLFLLLLTGIILGQLFSNLATFLMMIMDPNNFDSAEKALFASFNSVNQTLVYISFIPLLIVIGILFYHSRILDVFWLEHKQVISLGVDVKKTLYKMLVCIAIMVAIATALVGPVLFLGLLVANLTRQIFHTYQHRILLIGSALFGICMLIAGQWLVERIFGFSITLNVLINFIGGLYLIYLLRGKQL